MLSGDNCKIITEDTYETFFEDLYHFIKDNHDAISKLSSSSDLTINNGKHELTIKYKRLLMKCCFHGEESGYLYIKRHSGAFSFIEEYIDEYVFELDDDDYISIKDINDFVGYVKARI